MKKIQLVASILSLSVLLSSCARTYHPELVGHYKPNTSVAKKAAVQNSDFSENNIQPIPLKNKTGEATSVNENHPDFKKVQRNIEHTFQFSLSEKQQQKLDRNLEKVKSKVENNVAQSEKQSQQKNFSSILSAQKLSRSNDDILYIIVSIVLPPLAVYLFEDDITIHFWIDVLLTLLFWIPGVIYALIIIFAS